MNNNGTRLWDKIKFSVNAGLSSSKTIVDGAKQKSRELEELGVLKIDIKRLEGRNLELFKDLGVKVFSLFVEEGKASVTPRNSLIKDVLAELSENRDRIDSKNKKLGEIGSEID